MRAFFDHSRCKASRESFVGSYDCVGTKVRFEGKTALYLPGQAEKTVLNSTIAVSHLGTQLGNQIPISLLQSRSLTRKNLR